MENKKPQYYYEVISNKNDDVLYTGTRIEETIDWVNMLLMSMYDFSLMGELNNMQQWAGASITGVVKTKFDDKYGIPLYFINLILYKYNLRILDGVKYN